MSPVPDSTPIYILVGTQMNDGAVSTGIGEVYLNKTEAIRAKQRMSRPGVVITVVERELHGQEER